MNSSAALGSDLHVIEHLLGVLRRRWAWIAGLVVVGAVAGALYAESQAPTYASSATVMVRSGPTIDPVRQGTVTSTPEEEGQFLSQLEVIKSASLAADVAERLKLEEDADFARQPLSGYRRLVLRFEQLALMRPGAFSGEPAVARLDQAAVVSKLQAGVRALRAGRTYVAAISYSHSDAAVAARVAQTYAEAFRDRLAKANEDATARLRAVVEEELKTADATTRPALEEKYRDILLARALPGVDAVILSDARVPGAPIAPRKSFIVAVGAIIGAALGCLVAGWLELRDRGFRDGERLARLMNTRFLGYLPEVARARRTKGRSENGSFSLPEGAKHAIAHPFSRFAETIRSASVAAAPIEDDSAPVVGIVSVLPGEGKTVVAANLAAQVANRGKRVLLVDCHLRDPDMTEWLAGQPAEGLGEVALKGKQLAETVLYDRQSNISFLPLGANREMLDPAGLFSGAQFRELLESERGKQDLVILDLPALTAASDAVAIAPVVDKFLLVTEWGGPSEAFVAEALAGAPGVAEKLAGIIASRTQLSKLAKYAPVRSRGYFQYRIG